MCNFKESNAEPLHPTGYGWKIFSISAIRGSRQLGTMLNYDQSYTKHTEYDYIVNDIEPQVDHGFCFFREQDKAMALSILRAIKLIRIRHGFGSVGNKGKLALFRIRYYGGLGVNQEWHMFSDQVRPIPVALAKQFCLARPNSRFYL